MSQTILIECDIEMTLSDGTKLVSDVYRPAEGRWPVLLQRTPYSKEVLPGLMAFLNPARVARAGFAVVVQDVRGRFKSGGNFKFFADEGVDGAEAIEWAAIQPWSNGHVGMFGSSYMGATQMQAAAEAPERLSVICPGQASSGYYEGRSFRGGAFELGAMASISLWSQAPESVLRSGLDREGVRAQFAAVRRALSDLAGFLKVDRYEDLRDTVLRLAPSFFEWWEHDRADDPYWTSRSLEARYHKFRVPALHMTSWFDPFHVGALRNFEGLRSQSATEEARKNQALIVGPWGHYPPKGSLMGAARVGERDFGLDAVVDLDALQIAWFRRWLSDDHTGWRQRKPVRLFVMGRNEWREEDDWPLRRARSVALYPQAMTARGRTLSWARGGDRDQDAFVYDPANPVPTCGGAHLLLDSVFPQGPVNHVGFEDREDVLVYSGEPLDADVEVTGWVSARLWVRSSAPNTDFTVKLLDAWPDGRSFNVCDGIRRVDFAALTQENGWFKVDVELGATAMVFLKGHRMTVHISSSNFPRFDLNPNTGALPRLADKRVPARQEICLRGERASHLVLPVVD